jgi:GNAT superfamily N-acetyltransferase
METDQEIRRATHADAGLAAETLALAAADDPTVVWAIPVPGRRFEVLRAFYRVLLDQHWIGHGIVELVGDDAAAAVWLVNEPATRSAAEVAALDAAIKIASGEFADRVSVVLETMAAAEPMTPHLYLAWIGTRPDRQGQGLGSLLLRHGLARADATGSSTYLDASAPRNRVLYERHGFRVVHEHHLPEGPTFWGMWRDPSTAAT